MLPTLSNNFSQIAERIQRQNNRSLKELFKNDIRGPFLIEIKYRVLDAIGANLSRFYDLRWAEERMVTGGESGPEYDICKHIIGAHRANTIFFTAEERQRYRKTKNIKSNLHNKSLNK